MNKLNILCIQILTILTFSCELNSQKYKCYFFYYPDCPAAQNSIHKINALYKKFNKYGIDFIGVNPPLNNEISNEITKAELLFITINDVNYFLCKKYKITVSPEFIIVNNKNKILYRGAIDDYYFDVGKHKSKPSTNYLEDALQSIVNKKDIKINKTKSFGCYIEY